MEFLSFDSNKKSLQLKKGEIPVPKDDEVLIKVAYAGICGTDLHIIEVRFHLISFIFMHIYFNDLIITLTCIRGSARGLTVTNNLKSEHIFARILNDFKSDLMKCKISLIELSLWFLETQENYFFLLLSL